MYDQGEIIIVPFPFSDLSSVKQRPVLVLSKKIDNENAEDIITCGITSNLKDAKYSILIENSHLERGEIPTNSRIRVDKLFTINKNIVKKKVARVNQKTFTQVKDKFYSLL